MRSLFLLTSVATDFDVCNLHNQVQVANFRKSVPNAISALDTEMSGNAVESQLSNVILKHLQCDSPVSNIRFTFFVRRFFPFMAHVSEHPLLLHVAAGSESAS